MASSLDIIIQAQDKASGVLKDISKESTGLGSSLMKLIPAIAGVAAGFASWKSIEGAIDSTKELGAEVGSLMRITGLSAEAASHIIAAGKDTGVGFDTISKSLGILANHLKGINDAEEDLANKASANLVKSQTSAAESISKAGDALAASQRTQAENYDVWSNKMATTQDNLRTKIGNDEAKIAQLKGLTGAAATKAASEIIRANQTLASDQQHLSDLMLESRTHMAQANRAATDAQEKYNDAVSKATTPAQAAAEKSNAFTKALDDLGVKERDIIDESGAMRTHALDIIADGFNKMGPGLDRTADAMALFGRGGKEMIPLLSLGSKGLEEAAKQADKLGLTLSGKNVDDIRAYTKSQREMGEAIGGVKLQIGLALMPILKQLADWFVEHQPQIREFVTNAIVYLKAKFEELKPTVESLFATWKKGMDDAIIPAFNFIIEHKVVLIAAITAIGVAIVLAMGPESLAIAALVGLPIAFETVKNALPGLETSIKHTFSEITDFIDSQVNHAIDALNKIIDLANKVPGVNIANISKIGLGNRGLGPNESYAPDVPYGSPGYGGTSHAGGLPYVPYDGYPAILHKGEAVVTAAQNANGGGNVVINVNVSGSINGVDDVKRIIRETLSGGGLRGYSFG